MTQFDRFVRMCLYDQVRSNWYDAVTRRERTTREREGEGEKEENIDSLVQSSSLTNRCIALRKKEKESESEWANARCFFL